jgi:hypothetical protein
MKPRLRAIGLAPEVIDVPFIVKALGLERSSARRTHEAFDMARD